MSEADRLSRPWWTRGVYANEGSGGSIKNSHLADLDEVKAMIRETFDWYDQSPVLGGPHSVYIYREDEHHNLILETQVIRTTVWKEG